jgi:hypothetical protein
MNPIIPGDLFARAQTISGLRALADFLETNPAAPVDEYGCTFHYFPHEMTDAEGRAVVDRAAELLGVTPSDRTSLGGHYTAAKSFGRIHYEVTHISRQAFDAHRARASYTYNVVLDDPQDEAA